MRFCQCKSRLIKTKEGFSCPKCDVSESIIENDKTVWERETTNIITDSSSEQLFPFEKDQHYAKKEIWQKLHLSNQGGIRLNKDENFLVVFMDAPELYQRTSQGSNIYHDTFDKNTGLYQYTGAGQKRNQTLNKENGWLKNAEQNNTKIHFFRQFNIGKKHQYIGQVQVEKIISSIQPDSTGKNRLVYIFYLRPIKN